MRPPPAGARPGRRRIHTAAASRDQHLAPAALARQQLQLQRRRPCGRRLQELHQVAGSAGRSTPLPPPAGLCALSHRLPTAAHGPCDPRSVFGPGWQRGDVAALAVDKPWTSAIATRAVATACRRVHLANCSPNRPPPAGVDVLDVSPGVNLARWPRRGAIAGLQAGRTGTARPALCRRPAAAAAGADAPAGSSACPALPLCDRQRRRSLRLRRHAHLVVLVVATVADPAKCWRRAAPLTCQQPLINFGAGDAGTCAAATPRPCCLRQRAIASRTAVATRVLAFGCGPRQSPQLRRCAPLLDPARRLRRLVAHAGARGTPAW
ncbi:hypothetical protein LMG31884_46840 (plasmid) [Xanthomonas hydrangeae]|nr:hypothetical protein LMG31884_46840 [Xanthomonas hydrangeae]CAD7740581.1 hypothetical protein LMG31884_46840 [Xanthomonas hydrangeae]